MGEIRKQTLTGMKWTAIEKFSIQGVTFVIGIVLARLLDPSDFGLVGMLSIFLAISQTLIDGGFSNALVRKLDCSNEDYSTAFYTNVIMSLVCVGVIYVGAPWIADFFHQPILSTLARVYSINLFLGSFTCIQYAKLTHELNFRFQAKINFISSFVSGLAGIMLAFLGYGIWSLVWQSLMASIVRIIILYSCVRWWPGFRFSKESFNDLFGYGSKMMVSSLLHTVYCEMTTIFIGRFYSAAALGKYSRGTGMISMPLNTVSSIVQKVSFPIFAKLQNEDEKLIAVYRKYSSLFSVIVFFGTILIATLAKPIVLLLLGEKWEGAIIFMQIFCFAIIFDPICMLNLNLLRIKGRSDLFLKLEVIKKTISFIILCIAVPFGPIYICVSNVIYTQIAVVINTYYTGKLFGLGYWRQMKDYMPYLLLSIFACLPTYLLTYIIADNIVVIVTGTLVSVSIFIGILHVSGDSLYREYLLPVFVKIKRNSFWRCEREL